MKSISQAVEDILAIDDVPYFALQDGILNLSAYAVQIKKQVENACKKPLKSTSAVIMALSRIQRKAKKRITHPKLKIEGITLKRDLTELVISKTPENLKTITALLSGAKSTTPQILLITYGVNEINFVIQERDLDKIKALFKLQKPLAILPNLSSVTLGTFSGHAFVPNIFYTILRRLATKEINIVEIATTQLEITLIIEQKNLAVVYQTLSSVFLEKQQLY